MGNHVIPDLWRSLGTTTPARIALGRSGASQPTDAVLRFSLAHAQARDAVHAPFDREAVAREIAALGFETLHAASAAPDRASFLRRPDLGRRLAPDSRRALEQSAHGPFDLALIVADGLSSTAVHAQAGRLLAFLHPLVKAEGWTLAPIVIASQARVALGDEIGELFGARLVAMLIGERPGLSSPDSLGVYLTHTPRIGRSDAERNCISNIRDGGLPHEQAALKLMWLAREALRRALSGVNLKDESDLIVIASGNAAGALGR